MLLALIFVKVRGVSQFFSELSKKKLVKKQFSECFDVNALKGVDVLEASMLMSDQDGYDDHPTDSLLHFDRFRAERQDNDMWKLVSVGVFNEKVGAEYSATDIIALAQAYEMHIKSEALNLHSPHSERTIPFKQRMSSAFAALKP